MSTEWERWRARPRRLPRRLFVVGPRGGDADDALQPLLLQRHDEDEDDEASRMRRSEAAWRGDEDERCASCGGAGNESDRTGNGNGTDATVGCREGGATFKAAKCGWRVNGKEVGTKTD